MTENNEQLKQTLKRRADQSWELAGLARQDGDLDDAKRHTEVAQGYERQLRALRKGEEDAAAARRAAEAQRIIQLEAALKGLYAVARHGSRCSWVMTGAVCDCGVSTALQAAREVLDNVTPRSCGA